MNGDRLKPSSRFIRWINRFGDGPRKDVSNFEKEMNLPVDDPSKYIRRGKKKHIQFELDSED